MVMMVMEKGAEATAGLESICALLNSPLFKLRPTREKTLLGNSFGKMNQS
jgi:hypothetical protein